MKLLGKVPIALLGLCAALLLFEAGDVLAAVKPYFGRLIDASYTTTDPIDSDDLDCPYSAQSVQVYVQATTNGTVQAYYVPLGGESATAIDTAVSITANTCESITWARPLKRSRFRFTPSSSTGSVWLDGFCGGGRQ